MFFCSFVSFVCSFIVHSPGRAILSQQYPPSAQRIFSLSKIRLSTGLLRFGNSVYLEESSLERFRLLPRQHYNQPLRNLTHHRLNTKNRLASRAPFTDKIRTQETTFTPQKTPPRLEHKPQLILRSNSHRPAHM